MKKNYFRIKIQTLLLAGTAILLLNSCQEKLELNSIERCYDSSDEIQFQNYVTGMTRASRNSSNFINGDSIGVYGYQKSNEGSSVEVSKIFNNQKVTYNKTANTWEYSPVKYWEKSSTYDFYAIFPYSKTSGINYTFTDNKFAINDFSVEDDKDNQVDIMIAKRKIDQPSYQVVNFEFNHVLSNVSFLFKTADDFSPIGISQVEVLSFKVTNLYSTGTFTQNGWVGNAYDGEWTGQTTKYDLQGMDVDNFAFTPAQPVAPATTTQQTAVNLYTDLLLLPQEFADDAQIEIKYKITYDDGAEAVYRRKVNMNKIQGHLKDSGDPDADIAEWKPNYRYYYTIAADPSLNEQGGKYQAIANVDNDRKAYPTTTIAPTVNIIRVYLDSDNITDAYYVDYDLDGKGDYPILWQDLDGDGWLWGLVDSNNDGIPDDDDNDGQPNVIYLDINPRDNVVETPLRIPAPPVPTTPTPNPDDPTAAIVDYNGNADGSYTNPVAWLILKESGDSIDTDNDGIGDIAIVWQDIDGDGLLEGVADKDGNGILTPADAYDDDNVDYNGNPSTYDVIRYLDYSTADSPEWKDLEIYEIPEEILPKIPNIIEFSAVVEEWKGPYDAPVTFE